MKIYAKQVPPEYQESPLFLGDEFWPENVILDGNRGYNSHTTQEYDAIIRYFDEMAGEWENSNFYYEYSDGEYTKYRKKPGQTLAELLSRYGFSRHDGKPWTTKQRHKWRQLLEGDNSGDDDEVICAALDLITGRKWETTTIYGCCQGDWQDIIYPAEYGREWLEAFETEYFNTGEEWMVDPDGDNISVYTHGWREDDVRKEIADAYGCDPADVVLLKFTGWSRSASYEEVSA